jgi:hypothetical protein
LDSIGFMSPSWNCKISPRTREGEINKYMI